MTVDELLALTDIRFRELVDKEVRRNANERNKELDEIAQLLRDPRAAPRWRFMLVTMKKSVEGQLGAKRQDLARAERELSRADYEKKVQDYHIWRAGALRFKNGVEERILELNINSDRTTETLRDAIRQHRHTVTTEYSDDVSEADRALWSLID